VAHDTRPKAELSYRNKQKIRERLQPNEGHSRHSRLAYAGLRDSSQELTDIIVFSVDTRHREALFLLRARVRIIRREYLLKLESLFHSNKVIIRFFALQTW